MNQPITPVPDGMTTVTAHLVCEGAAEAIEFYKQAFDAVELARLPDSNGRIMHAMIRIGDAPAMLVDAVPERRSVGPRALGGSPVTLHLYVSDVDATFEQAVTAGATVTMAVDDMVWGDRYGKLVDPFGRHWSVATHVRDLDPEAIRAAAGEACG